MKEHIKLTLTELAKERQINILYACESGSRAWGFESPDSDWDVRFIYAHSLEWYLSLENKKDTIDEMLPLELDLGGWEIRKTLRLFADGNLALFEWINSPEIYFKNESFHQSLKALISQYFNPIKGMNHYLSMARKNVENHILENSVKIKKLFYILRPLLACEWIEDFSSMPPTEFSLLMRESKSMPEDIQRQVNEFLKQKETAAEGHLVELEISLVNWFNEQVTHYEILMPKLKPRPKSNWQELNKLMVDFVK
ncbi:nucleotidyltransferase domain-containing protein [Lentisphaera profundi]|uniref:Nucleotidyltransferase domain-containing protein n=1 Tax=Lentisphaera profundi TaxID=1658616 RepID=A0ABY7W0H6_9BACT|nr:nucleotidyltransferase domain-containing protein [Lentisphaera profundi]WDE99457.1 nucleotidyltransferase domain-containing protein [Lentisphaera profundi]